MVLTSYFLNTFVAPHFAEFTAVDAPDMSHHDPQQAYWIANYILNSGFRARFEEPQRQLAMGFLRRAEAAFTEYEAARIAALAVVGHSPSRMSRYFEALHHFEVFVSVAYQAGMLLKQLTGVKNIFDTLGGRRFEKRLFTLYNFIKHSNDKIAAGQFPEDGMVPVWLTNTGLECIQCQLTYLEMAELLVDLADTARFISDPEGVRSRNTAPSPAVSPPQ